MRHLFGYRFIFHVSEFLLDLGLPLFDFSRSHLMRHNTIGRTPSDEGWVHCRDLYLTTHNTHKRQTSMPLAGFEPAFSESEVP